MDDYKIFYESKIDDIPEDISPIKTRHHDDSLLHAESEDDKNNVEESLSLEPDSVNEPSTDYLKISDIKTSNERIIDLKSSLEQKAAKMMQRTIESNSLIDKTEQLKKREQLRNERVKQREKELKERERKRKMEIKQREKERELKLRSQNRDRK